MRTLVALFVVAQCTLAAAEPAPGRVLVANFSGPRPIAAPVTALVRARLLRGGRAALTETELRAAGVPATVEAGTERAHAALTAAGADVLVVGDVSEKEGRVTIAARSYGADGLPHGAATATVAEPDLDAGVETVTAQLGKDAGLGLDGNAHATLAELTPFADIDLVARANPKAAARLLAVADPAVAARIPDARAAALRVADQAALPIALRLRALLAAGAPERAAELTTGVKLDDEAKALAARAAALGATPAAVPASGKSAEWAVARAERALHDADVKAAAAAIAPYLGHERAVPSVLAMAARLPGGALGDAEPAVLASLDVAPTLAEPLVVRAAGKVPDEALAHAPLGTLTSAALHNLAATAKKDGPLAPAIAAELDRRAHAAAASAPAATTTAPAAPRPQAAPVAEPMAPVAAPARDHASPEVVAVAKELLPLLDGLGTLPRAAGRTVFVRVDGKDVGGASQWLDVERLRQALRWAVSHEPYALKVVDDEARAELSLRATPSLPRGRFALALALADRQSGKSDETALELPGLGAALVHVRIGFWLLLLALVLAVVGGGLFAFLAITRVGSLRVDVGNDLRSSRDTFAIRLSRSARAPQIADPDRFDADERKHGPKTFRRRRCLAAGTTEFSPLPVGTWYVHLYGLYVRDGQTHTLPALTRRVHVHKGQQAYLRFDLKWNAAPVRLSVKDGKPVAGAEIVIDSTAETLHTGPTGEATALLPPGEHALVVEARGMRLSRTVHVADPPAPIELTVDFMAARNAAQAAQENHA